MALHLIGTIHNDLKGPERLEAVLNYLKPEILAVEGCQDAFQQLRELDEKYSDLLIKVLKAKGAQADLIHYFEKTFSKREIYELEKSIQFADNNKIPIFFLDSSEYTAESVDVIEKKLNPLIEAIKCFPIDLNNAPVPSIDSEIRKIDGVYDSINFRMNSSTSLAPLLFEEELSSLRGHVIGRRDAVFEQKIRTLVKQNPEKRIVTVTGALHLVPDPQQQTLYERIKDLQPERLLLKQYAERIERMK